MRIRYAIILAAAALLPTLAQTPSRKPSPAADWPMYNRDLGGTRYSPLTQISTTNVANLKMAWSYRLSNAPAGRGAAPAPAPEAAAGQGGRGGGGGRGAAPVPTVNPEATPIVVNGVVFALSSGSLRGPSAMLYALDAATGRELWNSGSAITSFVDSGALAAGDGHVYVPTHDNTLYAFGIPLEH